MASLMASINHTFGLSLEDHYRRFRRGGGQPLNDEELAQFASEHSLNIFAMMEFQNREGRSLIFERNTDERILALISELKTSGTDRALK